MNDVFCQNGVTSPALLLAPMEGVTGPCFRKLIDKLGGPDLVATEFVRITSEKQKVKPFARFAIPLQIQLMSCAPEVLGGSIKFLKSRGLLFDKDWLDLNVGCPSRRVTSRGAGSALLLEPKKLRELIIAMRIAHPSGPLSIKTRLGFNSEEDFSEILAVLSNCPLDFITIHARSKAAKFEGPINYKKLAEAVAKLPYPVIGNGDIWTSADARTMIERTGVRGVMCGRGAIANPFIFQDIKNGSEANQQQRRLELLKFALDLLQGLENKDCKPGQNLGVFKEFSAWLSQNSLVGRSFFNNIKRLLTYAEIRSELYRFQDKYIGVT